MILAIASGKGGTGKTLISVNLARVMGEGVCLIDCDVEEPNDYLFLQGEIIDEQVIGIPVPKVMESLCDGCGECGRFCEYNAIVSFGTTPLIFPELCHGCGGCAKICPKKAIQEVENRIGVVQTSFAKGIKLTQGILDVGSPMATPLIRALRKHLRISDLTILDSPPGTSCPVIATIRGVDYVVLVTEPTPFGLNDLTLAVEMVRHLKIPFGVVINRVGVGDDRVHRYCHKQSIPILLEIPEDRRIAEVYSRGDLVVDALPQYRSIFQDLYGKIRMCTSTPQHEGTMPSGSECCSITGGDRLENM